MGGIGRAVKAAMRRIEAEERALDLLLESTSR